MALMSLSRLGVMYGLSTVNGTCWTCDRHLTDTVSSSRSDASSASEHYLIRFSSYKYVLDLPISWKEPNEGERSSRAFRPFPGRREQLLDPGGRLRGEEEKVRAAPAVGAPEPGDRLARPGQGTQAAGQGALDVHL